MPQSPVANAMAAAAGKVYPDGVWGPKSYTKDDGTQYTGGEWLVPGRNISRVPGIVRGFSDVLHLSEFGKALFSFSSPTPLSCTSFSYTSVACISLLPLSLSLLPTYSTLPNIYPFSRYSSNSVLVRCP